MKVANYYDPSSAGTLTRISPIEHICECVLPPTARSQ
jgi:hypothetical protein